MSDLPEWVMCLVRAIQASEDTHPQYLMDTATEGIVALDSCPEMLFLSLIPHEVRRAAGGGY